MNRRTLWIMGTVSGFFAWRLGWIEWSTMVQQAWFGGGALLSHWFSSGEWRS